MLTERGRVMMAGEPVLIDDPDSLSCPYPWGIRLEAEVAAIVRFRRWYELGFHQDILKEAFERHGFRYVLRPGVISDYATIHEFTVC